MQGWGRLFLRFKKKFQSAHALAVHLHGAGSSVRAARTDFINSMQNGLPFTLRRAQIASGAPDQARNVTL
ncbi:MAG: hypothetical protein RI953_1544 [Pseudomonadota bacterium]